MAPNPSRVLWLVGTPLDESQPLSPEAVRCLQAVEGVIGENRSQQDRYLRSVPKPHTFEIVYLDPERAEEEKTWREWVRSGKSLALFSDTGMPCLFDPGVEILEAARRAGYTIRCVPSATSWGTAAAVSGYAPPFLIVGFPPRKSEDREKAFQTLRERSESLVLLETPYRFPLLLTNLAAHFPADRKLFLAWDIARPTERYWWGTVKELEPWATSQGLKKGEFILILAGTHAG